MYLSKFQNVFVNFMKCRRRLLGKNLSAKGVWPNFICLIAKCICLNCKMHLSKFYNVFVNFIKYRRGLLGKKFPRRVFGQTKCICTKCQMYLSKLQNVFVYIAKCICLNCKMYLSKFHNVFVNFIKCRRGLLGKNLSAKGVWPNFATTLLLLLLLHNFIKYEVKLFRQSPMLT